MVPKSHTQRNEKFKERLKEKWDKGSGVTRARAHPANPAPHEMKRLRNFFHPQNTNKSKLK